MNHHVFKRLLEYPHAAVFEKSPDDSLAFVLRHPEGARWRIDDGQLDVWAGDLHRVYDLSLWSVGALAAALQSEGFVVQQVNQRFAGMSAMVLVDGQGDQASSDGDHITAFTSLLWVLFSGHASQLDAMHYQIRQALLQMALTTADGQWLDLWGQLYGIMRLPGETDAQYRARIPLEAFRLRVNPRAIEKAILELTGKNVSILEPWTSVFVLDDSELDGDDKTQDENHVGYFFIQPRSLESIDWTDVLEVIERNRPAGVLMLPPEVYNGWHWDTGLDPSVGFSITRIHAAHPVIEDAPLLDWGNYDDRAPTLNYPFMCWRTTFLPGAHVRTPSLPWVNLPWDEHDWRHIKHIYRFSLQSTPAEPPPAQTLLDYLSALPIQSDGSRQTGLYHTTTLLPRVWLAQEESGYEPGHFPTEMWYYRGANPDNYIQYGTQAGVPLIWRVVLASSGGIVLAFLGRRKPDNSPPDERGVIGAATYDLRVNALYDWIDAQEVEWPNVQSGVFAYSWSSGYVSNNAPTSLADFLAAGAEMGRLAMFSFLDPSMILMASSNPVGASYVNSNNGACDTDAANNYLGLGGGITGFQWTGMACDEDEQTNAWVYNTDRGRVNSATVAGQQGVRPCVALDPGCLLVGGSGSLADPFIVGDPVEED